MNKKNKYATWRVALQTFGTSIVAIIFSSLLTLSLGGVSDNFFWTALMQLLSLLIYVSIIYSPSWYCGDHDSNSVHFGRMQEDLNKGIKIGLLTMIPYMLTPVLLVLSKLQAFGIVDLGFVYRILNMHLLYAINWLIPPEKLVAEVSWLAIIGVWLYHLIIPVTCAVAYRLGYMHVSISERLIFKNLPKNPKSSGKKNQKKRG
ncbi:MAG: hypothetical protein HFG27_04970 [Provencibacterium sp.]|jgi:hypothetical protein|nr:hypothetical protein [Provencibacterium sp.]